MNAPPPPSACVVILTGAGSGIGREAALALARAGLRVALVGRTESTLAATAASVAEVGGEAMTVTADVAQPDSAGQVVGSVERQWGRIDALVNNAGIAPLIAIADSTARPLADVFAANTIGPALLIARCWPIFMRQGGGCIVNVSSMATVDPFPGFFAYAASKAALESMTRSADVEGREQGIRSFAIAPGAVETPLLRTIVDESQLPTACTLPPSEVASVIVDCVLGRRDEHMGTTVHLPSPTPG